ncbi:TerD family protein [Candidatus Epulonipiscium viviparus]|uniref:TerD family protein n=1 Tax=Candidatus Epulonipiscium viviparus TaxID=420336 RepID=UPI0027380913|nr:TerD family protein [Candidatus Epulopiscium viviparus]
MAINLQKGQKVSLTKASSTLSKLLIGLGWDTNKYDGGHQFDLDTSVFMVGSNDKVLEETDFIFYGNLKHKSGSVEHTGDNRTGEGDGDDEVIKVNLALVPDEIKKIVFTVTIHDANERNQNFGLVSNSFIRIVDQLTNTEIVRYDLGEDFSIETALVVGELYKHQGAWRFAAIGSGYSGGLPALCAAYGVDV